MYIARRTSCAHVYVAACIFKRRLHPCVCVCVRVCVLSAVPFSSLTVNPGFTGLEQVGGANSLTLLTGAKRMRRKHQQQTGPRKDAQVHTIQLLSLCASMQPCSHAFVCVCVCACACVCVCVCVCVHHRPPYHPVRSVSSLPVQYPYPPQPSHMHTDYDYNSRVDLVRLTHTRTHTHTHTHTQAFHLTQPNPRPAAGSQS